MPPSSVPGTNRDDIGLGRLRSVVTNPPALTPQPHARLDDPASGADAARAVTGSSWLAAACSAMGDPSAVINLMLRYPATGVRCRLASTSSKRHVERRGGKLTSVGEFRQQGHYGGESGLSEEIRDQFAGLLQTLEDVREGGLPGSFAVLLGALLALASGVWTARVATRPYKRAIPRYASGVPLVGQGGVAGRAAVLAAPTTHRASPCSSSRALSRKP